MQNYIEQQLQNIDWNVAPRELYQPIGYALESGGKRLRPTLVLMACELFGGSRTEALPAALAIEIFHNFTLLHDDVMDCADVRRGRPTVHRKWDTNTAILSGDAMMIKAYEQLQRLPENKLCQVLPIFTQTALQVCEGQQFDINFERCEEVSLTEYYEMIRLKTAVLLAAALKIGAIVGGASEKDADLLYNYGIEVGIAFQLKDDYLDTFGDEKTFGKRIGGDILCGKKTFLLINALDRANDTQRTEIRQTLADKSLPEAEKIAKITNIYQQLDIPKICEETIEARYQQAVAILHQISGAKNSLQPLEKLAEKLVDRKL